VGPVSDYQPNRARHRGRDRDRLSVALGAAWAAGHLIVFGLLGLSCETQLHTEAAPSPHCVLDREPPV